MWELSLGFLFNQSSAVVLASLINFNSLKFGTKIQIASSSLSIAMLALFFIALYGIKRGLSANST